MELRGEGDRATSTNVFLQTRFFIFQIKRSQTSRKNVTSITGIMMLLRLTLDLKDRETGLI